MPKLENGVKIQITVSHNVLAILDETRSEYGISRSAQIAVALERYFKSEERKAKNAAKNLEGKGYGDE